MLRGRPGVDVGRPRRGSKLQTAESRGEYDAAWICEGCQVKFTKEDSKLLVCDYCDLYFCTECLNLPYEQYETMSAAPGTCWFSVACQTKASDCIKTETQIEERCAEYLLQASVGQTNSC